MNEKIQLVPAICHKARLTRDARFDGQFFVAVKTTGIYCRPICPVSPPKEENVCYFASAIEAANAGYRPCLRCRPDSAPQSAAWQGTQTTFMRAMQLIDEGALQHSTLSRLCERLGVSDRYLRLLFQENIGTSPKSYALYCQCLFAKKLLHETQLSITEVALASGFNSIRRFNDCFKKNIRLTPSEIRRSKQSKGHEITLKLYYRPPFDWKHMLSFLRARAISGVEWLEEEEGYARTFRYKNSDGWFVIKPSQVGNYFNLTLNLNRSEYLNLIVHKIRQLFDLDAEINAIDQQLKPLFNTQFEYTPGLRIPGIWGCFEAGTRAILGQQVSVSAARKLVIQLVGELGAPLTHRQEYTLFPRAETVAKHELSFLKLPDSRRQTLRRFARWYATASEPDNVLEWLNIKGIGPWTVNYVLMRGKRDPDIWLDTDLGVKNVLKKAGVSFNDKAFRPWRSYLTFHCWNQL